MVNKRELLSPAERKRVTEVRQDILEARVEAKFEAKVDSISSKLEAELQTKFDLAAQKIQRDFEERLRSIQVAYSRSAANHSLELLENISPEELRKTVENLLPAALQTLEDIVSGNIEAPISTKARVAAFLLACAGYGPAKLASKRSENSNHEAQKAIASVIERATKVASDDAAEIKRQQRLRVAQIEAAKLGIPREDYLDDDDLKFYALKAPDDHALELVALAYLHRDYTQLEDDGYEELDNFRKGAEAKYALDYISELRTGTREYQYVITSAMFESDSLEMNDAGQFRF